MATVLKEDFGVKKGDTVIIYMPMIAEGAFAMLACARIGAIHSVVFGGFSAKELASRLDHCQPKVVITASAGIEPNRIINYPDIVEEAIAGTTTIDKNIPRLIKQRKEGDGKYYADGLNQDLYRDWDTLMDKTTKVSDCAIVGSNDPLYILYTSGTTGAPKGVVREHGGTCVGTNLSIKASQNLYPGDVMLAVSDWGWIVGHSWMTYGPLLRGASTIIFEGKPHMPDPGIIWRMCQQYKVTSMFLAPTVARLLKKEDYSGSYVKKHFPEDLQVLGMAGERCDPDSILWLRKNLHKQIINDEWWQTETGHVICGNIADVGTYKTIFPTLPGSATRPYFGQDVKIFDEHNEECEVGELGKVMVKLPMPPAFASTLWRNDQAFQEKYFDEAPGYYLSGDAGTKDENGYVSIMTRIDDVINMAGHRISTGRIEEVVNEHSYVVESAVVAFVDPIKGETPLAFVVIRDQDKLSKEEVDDIIKKVKTKVREDIGAFSSLNGVIPISTLPKTRSGKILRGTMKSIVGGVEYKMPATIEDPAMLDLVDSLAKEWRIATYGE